MTILYHDGTDIYRNWVVAEDEFNAEYLGKF